VELYGSGLDAFFPVTDTEIGRIGCIICMEGSYPETARGLAMNGAEIVYRPSYPEPYVANGLWEVQNRARALDNTMYVVAPNPAAYLPMPESQFPIDTFGGKSMIVDYQGRVISNHEAGGAASYAGAIIDIEALRQYRARSRWGNWLRICAQSTRLIYDQPLYEQNRCRPAAKHAENDEVVTQVTERMRMGIWKRPWRVQPPETVLNAASASMRPVKWSMLIKPRQHRRFDSSPVKKINKNSWERSAWLKLEGRACQSYSTGI
jgi:hypothetical protein